MAVLGYVKYNVSLIDVYFMVNDNMINEKEDG
jgi:hypothetical protein